jgi:hypothetical protein
MGAVLVAGAGYWLAQTQPWHRRAEEPEPQEQAPALESLGDVGVTDVGVT